MYIYSITINLFYPFSFFFFKFYLSISVFEELIASNVLLVTLIAGTILIHPAAFYFFMIIFFFKFFKFNNFLHISYLRLQRALIIYFLVITLSLGGFWGTQSNTWGYFWVDDLIEWLLLSSIIYGVIFIHFYLFSYGVVNFFINHCLLLNFLIFVRLGFLSTRHNFISINFFFYINLYLYLCLTYIISNLARTRCNILLKLSITYIFFLYNSSFSKYVFIMFIILSFFKKISLNIKLITFHHLLYFLVLFWIFSFYYYSILHVYSSGVNFIFNKHFINILSGEYLYSIYSKYFQQLNFITFLWGYYKYAIFSYFNQKVFLVFNNHSLLYLTFIILVKLFEFRFLYKKKTYF